MLYVIYGTDTQKARKKLTDLLDAFQKKRQDAPLIRINQENWSEAALDEALSSAGLFAPKNVIVFDSLLTKADTAESLMSRLNEIAASEHVCIIIEEKIKAPELKKLESKAEKVQETNFSKDASQDKKQFPRTFAFADALAIRDKKKSWSIFQSLLADSLAAEEIHGVIWWQFKSIKLAATSKSAKEAGLNPFVYGKCQGFSRQWTPDDLDEYLLRLVSMYHNAHRGENDFMSELETLCL